MKKSLITAAISLYLPCISYATVDEGEDVTAYGDQLAYLEPPNIAGFYSPTDTLNLRLKTSNTQLPKLSLELDGIDVTALMTHTKTPNAQELQYTPAQRLTYGTHELRLMEYKPDGSVIEWGYWELDVRHSAKLRQASAQSQLDLTINQRITSHSSPATLEPADNFSAQGVGQLNGLLEGDNWAIEAKGSVALADDASQSLTGREADIPYFTINAKQGRYSATLGDHSVFETSLLSNGYQQRGVSGSVALPALESSVTLFSVAANQRVGIAGGSGLNDSDNRLNGFRWQYQPLQSPNSEVYVTANYIDGKVSQPDHGSVDFNAAPTPLVNNGNAWSLLVDGQFIQRQLRLRLESANTEFDFDGENTGFNAQKDNAWSALAVYQAQPTQTTSASINTTIGVEVKQIGSFYHSIANGQLPADKKFQRVFFNGIAATKKGDWSWDSAFSTETNNLDKNLSYAISDMSQWALSGNYNPYEAFKKESPFAWLGLPIYSLALRRVVLNDEHTPVGFIENNLSTETIQANALFSQTTSSWSLGLSEDTLTDKSGWQPNTRIRALQANATKQFGDRYYLALAWQWQQTAYLNEQKTTHKQLFSLDAQAEFIPKKLNANISIGTNQNRASNDPYFAVRDQSNYANANLSWTIRQPKNNRAGLNLSMSISHNKYKDKRYALNNTSGYQAFIKLSTSLPSAFPGEQ